MSGRYDIVGYDDEVGYDDDDVDAVLSGYDIVGARRRPMGPARGFMGRAVARPRPRATVAPLAGRAMPSLVKEQVPTKSRRTGLPLESTGTIAAGVTATVVGRPQDLAFKAERIIIPSTIAPDFLVVDVKVGNRSQFTASGNHAGEIFAPGSSPEAAAMFDFDTCGTSQDFIMIVQNISGAARTFRATVLGHALQA